MPSSDMRGQWWHWKRITEANRPPLQTSEIPLGLRVLYYFSRCVLWGMLGFLASELVRYVFGFPSLLRWLR